MTYDEAVAELKACYDAGQHDIAVTPEVYNAYRDGLPVLWRVGGPPSQAKECLAFKTARVRKVQS